RPARTRAGPPGGHAAGPLPRRPGPRAAPRRARRVVHHPAAAARSGPVRTDLVDRPARRHGRPSRPARRPGADGPAHNSAAPAAPPLPARMDTHSLESRMRIHASACPSGAGATTKQQGSQMAKTIEEYAVALVAEGAESYAEDDTDENGELDSTDDLRAAI